MYSMQTNLSLDKESIEALKILALKYSEGNKSSYIRELLKKEIKKER